jgi:hypothetical protein
MTVRFKIGEHNRMDVAKYLLFKYGHEKLDAMISEAANEKIAERRNKIW